MRLVATSDLHFNHTRSRPLAAGLIEQINRVGGDVLLVGGDTASADGDALEQCLSLFRFAGPKLIVAGNHELWTHGPDSHALFVRDLPQRVRALGWHWLEGEPFLADQVAVVGTVGWYDYAFASPRLAIPRRFYERKVSPGVARRLDQHHDLLARIDDIPPHTMDLYARWNDGRHVKLHRDDGAFLDERLADLRRSLDAAGSRRILAFSHHVPHAALLPPAHGSQWDFAFAFLGSPRIGQTILDRPNVSHLLCGHSHFPVRARIGPTQAINIGSGYRWKTYEVIDL